MKKAIRTLGLSFFIAFGGRANGVGFSIGNKGYQGIGSGIGEYAENYALQDMWEMTIE